MFNKELGLTLGQAYAPCEELHLRCKDMIYDPRHGQIPRGFYGAEGELDEIQLVMILMEPAMSDGRPAHNIFDVWKVAKRAYGTEDSLGHRRMREILQKAFPGLEYPKEVMRRVWITESILCSRPSNGIRFRNAQACITTYLVKQLDLMPDDAIIGAMGVQTYERVSKHAPKYKDRLVRCYAPFGYRGGWAENWDELIERVRELNGTNNHHRV